VPVIDLGTTPRDGWRPGVMLDVAGRQGALAVDTLLGQEDIVVGPVDAPLGTPRWINGATVLSDGVPALILDPTALV
jgi:two-component system chemotaxis sensor kinase CheA